MKNKIVLIYAYYETDVSKYNLSFFIKKLRNNIDYIFIVNGFTCSIKIPEKENITVVRRENTGFDFGAYRVGIDMAKEKDYQFYFFVNCGVFGPILPCYSEDSDWTQIFTSKINDVVKVVGTIIYHPDTCPIPQGNIPAVEGYFFCTDRPTVELLLTKTDVFTIHATKERACHLGEYGISYCLFTHGYSIDCILRRYKGVDWRDPRNWKNKGVPLSRPGFYYGTTVNPYELVFHKWCWSSENQLLHPKIIYDYSNDHIDI